MLLLPGIEPRFLAHKNQPLISPEQAQASPDKQESSFIPDGTKETGDFDGKNK